MKEDYFLLNLINTIIVFLFFMTNSSPQFRIGNGYDNDDLEEDWFWDM